MPTWISCVVIYGSGISAGWFVGRWMLRNELAKKLKKEDLSPWLKRGEML